MSAQDTQDQRRDAPPPTVGALLAAGVAARTLSTPPEEGAEPDGGAQPEPAGGPEADSRPPGE